MRTGRKRGLSAVIALLLVAVLTAACGQSGTTGRTPSSEANAGGSEAATPEVGGQFVWASLADASNFNPILVNDTASGDIVPDLATWDVSPDGLTWTFHLKDGVKWQDGEAAHCGRRGIHV